MSDNPFDVYLFDDRMHAWRNLRTGRTVATATVQAEIQTHIDAGKAVIDQLTQQLLSGDLTIDQWKLAVAGELKDMHGAFAMLGAGGRDNMTQAMWGEVGSRLKQEYIYLNNFAKEIEAGKLSEGQILARLKMYTNDAYGSFADAERTLNMNNGMTEERAVLTGSNHCPDCEYRAGQGWQPIGTLPDIGDTQCGSNDRCYFEYR